MFYKEQSVYVNQDLDFTKKIGESESKCIRKMIRNPSCSKHLIINVRLLPFFAKLIDNSHRSKTHDKIFVMRLLYKCVKIAFFQPVKNAIDDSKMHVKFTSNRGGYP